MWHRQIIKGVRKDVVIVIGMISPYQLLLFGKKESKKATNVALPGAACSKTMVRNVGATPSALIISVSRKHER